MFAGWRDALRAVRTIATVAAMFAFVPTVAHGGNPPLSGASGIAVGGLHACARLQTGGAMCWGSAYSGALGRLTDGRAAAPVEKLTTPLAKIAAGNDHTCVVTASGGLLCFGNNSWGQLGLGIGAPASTSDPQAVVGLGTGVTDVAAGYDHTCAIAGGAANCWGDNLYGELGDGNSQTQQFAPVPVVGLAAGVSAIAAGGDFSCAIVNGAVKCWGVSFFGQIGDGTEQPRLVPTQVVGITSGATSVATGRAHACAIAGGTVKCWGYNLSGQLGDGTLTQRPAPVNVVGASSGFVAIAAGNWHTCGLRNDGDVQCWGENSAGQLGDGTRERRTIAGPVVGLGAPALAIAAGGDATCVLLNDATVRCFGSGQLGINALPARIKPVEVAPVTGGFAAVDGGEFHSCGVSGTGATYCWGLNNDGQLGDNTLSDRAFPTPVAGLGAGVAEVAPGSVHTCARSHAGAALCWGANVNGLLGTGSTVASKVPVVVTGLGSGVSQLAAGQSHNCVVTTAGAAKCWGSNSSGQLGDGSVFVASAPVGVAGLESSAQRVSVGADHSCALRTDGGIKCWGSNLNGRLGDGTLQQRLTPVDVVGLTAGVAAVTLGDSHSCALTTAGAVRCWGSNSVGQLGDGSFVAERAFPHPVVGLVSGVVALAAGGSHTCALLATGGVRCWGSNIAGQVGEYGGGFFTPARLPVDVPLPEPAVAVSAGRNHSCAVFSSGKARCWGESWRSQLGNGDAGYSTTPRVVVLADLSTSVTLATDPNPSHPGDYVTITVTLNAPDSVPGGSVVFKDGDIVLPCNVFGAMVPVVQGKAQCVLPLSLGAHTLSAEYSGDVAHSPATASMVHTVVAVAGQHCAGFDDVDLAHPMCRSVEWVRNRGITLGCAGFDYCPGASVNRLTMAAFMNRLGRALTPEVVSFYGIFGSIPLFGVTSCFTPDVLPAAYPRRAYVDAVISGTVAIDTDIKVEPLALFQQLPSAVGPATRRFIAANRFDSIRAQASFDIPADVTTRFALEFTRIGNGSNYIDSSSCTVRAVVVNRDETYAPFDQP